MCGGAGVEVADGGCPVTFRCPYCHEGKFTVKAKLLTPFEGNIVCGACGETSRTKQGFLFGGLAFVAFFAGAVGALWLTFRVGPYLSLAAFALFLLGLFALGRLLAPVWRLDAPYRAGFTLGIFFSRLFKSAK